MKKTKQNCVERNSMSPYSLFKTLFAPLDWQIGDLRVSDVLLSSSHSKRVKLRMYITEGSWTQIVTFGGQFTCTVSFFV